MVVISSKHFFLRYFFPFERVNFTWMLTHLSQGCVYGVDFLSALFITHFWKWCLYRIKIWIASTCWKKGWNQFQISFSSFFPSHTIFPFLCILISMPLHFLFYSSPVICLTVFFSSYLSSLSPQAIMIFCQFFQMSPSCNCVFWSGFLPNSPFIMISDTDPLTWLVSIFSLCPPRKDGWKLCLCRWLYVCALFS